MRIKTSIIARNEEISELRQSMRGFGRFLLVLIISFFLFPKAWSQVNDTTHRITKSDAVIKKQEVYIDGKISSRGMEDIKPEDILWISVVKNASRNPSGTTPADRGALFVTTKQGAIKSYEKKFSSFSNEYRQYIDKQGSDQMCNYFIDGKSLDKDDKDFIVKLYDIPSDKIQAIIVQAPRPIDNFIGLNVRITTKK